MLGTIPNRRAVLAWGAYDLANQSFQLFINTLFFSLFVQQVVVVGDEARGGTVWSYMVAGAMGLTVIASPLAGVIADDRALKLELLLGTGVICSLLTAGLALIQPGQVWAAAALYTAAALACGLGENFLGSFLPEIATPATMGRVSAIGWTMSYLGALALLAAAGAAVHLMGWSDAASFRPLFVFAGAWFLVWMTPAALFLRERARPAPRAGTGLAGATARRLARSVAAASSHGQLARFLAVFFVYSMGTYTVIYFMGQIGVGLGFGLDQLILFSLEIALTAGAASLLAARFQDRLGHRRTIMFFLAVWIVATASLAAGQRFGAPAWSFWAVAACIGVGLGGIGTASRAMVGLFTPEGRAAEFFGLWGMTAKLAAIAGVLVFGQLGLVTGVTAVVGFFAAGLALMLLIDERAGAEQARVAALLPTAPPAATDPAPRSPPEPAGRPAPEEPTQDAQGGAG